MIYNVWHSPLSKKPTTTFNSSLLSNSRGCPTDKNFTKLPLNWIFRQLFTEEWRKWDGNWFQSWSSNALRWKFQNQLTNIYNELSLYESQQIISTGTYTTRWWENQWTSVQVFCSKEKNYVIHYGRNQISWWSYIVKKRTYR